MATADIVLFAIQAGVRLYGAGRKAYVDSVRANAVTLPLPDAPNGFTHNAAWAWFTNDPVGREAREAAGSARLEWLLTQPLDPDEQEELKLLGATIWAERSPATAPRFDATYTGEEIIGVLEVRQWARSEDALPSPLQTIAGTLVNIGVDYFAYMPGAVSKNSATGRALLSFLGAIDDTDFAAAPLHDIAEDLMVAVLDSVAVNPDLVTGSDHARTLVANVTRTLAASASAHLADAPVTERWEASFWLQMVARSVLKGSSDTVLANPELFLGVRAGAEANVIREVGAALADLVIGPQAVTFRPLITQEGLNTITRAALTAVSRNPEILKIGHQGLKNVLVALAGDVGKHSNLLTGDILPELARLVLEKSADNMDLIWGKSFKSPERHLLVTASKELLLTLSRKPGAGEWSPTLNRDQILGISETVFDEVIDNPDWLVKKAGETSSPLKIAVAASLGALRRHGGPRLSADAGVGALKAAIKAVGTQNALLEKLPPGGSDHGKVAVAAALDAILETALSPSADPAAKWRIARNSSILTMVEVGLAALSKEGGTQADIDILRLEIGKIAAGTTTLAQFGESLEAHLRRDRTGENG